MPSENYIYPSLLKKTQEVSGESFLDSSPLGVRVYSNCHALPYRQMKNANGEECWGGGLCCDGEWIVNSGVNYNSLTPYRFDPNEALFLDEEVIYIGMLSSIWGHAITDGIQHLWWLSTEEYQSKHKQTRIYYSGDAPLSGNFLELLRLAGVEVSKLCFVDRILCFRSVIVPDSCFVSNYPEIHYHPEYIRTLDFIVANGSVETHHQKKIFLSLHEDTRNRGVSHIENVVRKAGYEVVYPGRCSLQEQISMLQAAEAVMTFDGSVGHNVLFCKPGTRIAVLRKANYINEYQMMVNGIRDYEVNIIDVHLSWMNKERFPYGGPFFVYANELLCSYLNVPCPSFPWSSFRAYLRYNLYDDYPELLARLSVPEEYASRLAREIESERQRCQKIVSSTFKYLPLPNRIKTKLVTRIVKSKVRHLLG